MSQQPKLDELNSKQKLLEKAKQDRENQEANILKMEEESTKRMIRKGKIQAMVQQEIENAIRAEGEKADQVKEEVQKEEQKKKDLEQQVKQREEEIK